MKTTMMDLISSGMLYNVIYNENNLNSISRTNESAPLQLRSLIRVYIILKHSCVGIKRPLDRQSPYVGACSN